MQAQHIEFLQLFNGPVQYVVPRWQRRYRWGQSDIERLVEDLLTVASAGPDAAHYGGTLLTFPEPGVPSGVVKPIRVVDGQQRLTTVSILLACIANRLGPEGRCADWTVEIIRDDRLTNPRKGRYRKLRLQDGDEEEYRYGLEGNPRGSGPVTQAWKTLRRLVARHDLALLLAGLERLRVVSIGLGDREDPQQIFESLNATGRPLTESEKVKNWLLMGLPDEVQQDLYENHWVRIERTLGAEHTTDPTDTFLRDVLRWRTGELHGIERVYDGLRRWAVKQGYAEGREGRPALCRDLARLAELYGILTGAAGRHPATSVERELRHLREMRIDVHRPLSLRLLNDASGYGDTGLTHEALAKTLARIGTWTTRLWLADRPTAGMNTAVAELAHGPGPSEGEDSAEYWLGRIRRLRNTRVGVPRDEQVREGIRARKAYGGSATRSSFAVLCALMEAEENPGEAPARDQLTIEHVMPQKLTEAWKGALGDGAEEIHGRYRDRLANLTLSGDVTNIGMAADPFNEKRQVYSKSTMKLTQRLAHENEWSEEALERRAEDLARRVLQRWPWSDPAGVDEQTAALRWRLEGGPWHTEHAASQMVLNVAGALLSRDPENAKRLSGEAVSSNVHLASSYPPGTAAGTLTMRGVPGHGQYVLYPYEQDYPTSAERCRKMGERCRVQVEVDFEEDNRPQAFWRFLKEHSGGVPGQKDTWRGANQWTSPVNSAGDRIGMYVGNPDHLRLYIRAGESQPSEDRAARMRRYSWMIRDQMGDQETGGNLEKYSSQGTTVYVQRGWARDDEAGWPDAAQWIEEQHERLRTILGPVVEHSGTGAARHLLKCTDREGWLRRDPPRRPGDKATYTVVTDIDRATVYRTRSWADKHRAEAAALFPGLPAEVVVLDNTADSRTTASV